MHQMRRRFPALPLSEQDKAAIYKRIMHLPEEELVKLFPTFLSDTAVATFLKTFLPQPQPALMEGMLARDPMHEIINRHQIQELPTLSELGKWLVKKPDGLAFPVSVRHFLALKDADIDHFIEPEKDGVTCSRLADHLGHFIELPTHGHTKASFIHLWESFVGDILKLFCQKTVVSDRDTNLDFWPDCLFFIDKYPVIRGKESPPGTSSSIPLAELREKTKWVYGRGVPYLLAYSAVGVTITFVALFQENTSAGVQVKPLVSLDLMQMQDRVKLLTVLFNLARLQPLLAKLCVESGAVPDLIESGAKKVQPCGAKFVSPRAVSAYVDYGYSSHKRMEQA